MCQQVSIHMRERRINRHCERRMGGMVVVKVLSLPDSFGQSILLFIQVDYPDKPGND